MGESDKPSQAVPMPNEGSGDTRKNTPDVESTHQFDRMIALIGDLARQSDGRSLVPIAPPTSFWSSVAKHVGTFVLGAALTLGISHEAHTPVAHEILQQVSVSASVPDLRVQQASLAQINADVSRFGQKLSDAGASPDSYQTLLQDIGKDIKSALKFPCAQPAIEEGIDLSNLLQLEASRKVASAEQITSVERRVKRFIDLVQSLCSRPVG